MIREGFSLFIPDSEFDGRESLGDGLQSLRVSGAQIRKARPAIHLPAKRKSDERNDF